MRWSTAEVCPSGSCESATACASTPNATLTAPVLTTARADNSMGGYLVTLKWSAVSGAAGYQVSAKGPGDDGFGAPTPVSALFHSTLVELPESAQQWEFRVQARDSSGGVGPASSWIFRLRDTLVVKHEVELTASATAVAISGDGAVAAVATKGGWVSLYQIDGTTAQRLPRAIDFGGEEVHSLGLIRTGDEPPHRYLYAVAGDEARLVEFTPETKDVATWTVGGDPQLIRFVDSIRRTDGTSHILFLTASSMDLVLWDLEKTGTDQYAQLSTRVRHQDMAGWDGGRFEALDLDLVRAADDDGTTRTHVAATDGEALLFAGVDAATGKFVRWDVEESFERSGVTSPYASVLAASHSALAMDHLQSITGGEQWITRCHGLDGVPFPCLPTVFRDSPRALLYTPVVSRDGITLGGADLLVAPPSGPLELWFLSQTRVVLPESTAGVSGPEGLAAAGFSDASGAPVIRVAAGAGERLVVLEQKLPASDLTLVSQ